MNMKKGSLFAALTVVSLAFSAPMMADEAAAGGTGDKQEAVKKEAHGKKPAEPGKKKDTKATPGN